MLEPEFMRYRSVFVAGLLVPLASSGCDNKCSGTYNCAYGGGAVLVPANLAPVSTVAADAPCSIDSQPPYSSYILVYISGERTGTCTVRALLSDGTQLVASLSYQPLTCCGRSYGTGATFTIAGAGAGDGATAD